MPTPEHGRAHRLTAGELSGGYASRGGWWRLVAMFVLLLAHPACAEAPTPEVDADPVVAAAGPEAVASGSAAAGTQTVESDSATGADSPAAATDGAAAGGEAAPQDTAAPSPPPQPLQELPQPTIDSLAAAMGALAEAQQLILSRLDSIEAGVPAAAPADTAGGVIEGLVIEEATDEVRGIGIGIFWSLVVILVFHFLIRVVAWILETLAERSVARRLSFKWLIPITRMTLWAIATYLIINNVFRVDAQGLLAASAALGVAVGIAAQDMLKNVLGGLIVVFDQPFQVGDKIRVGSSYGEVVSIGLRSTRIVTADDDLVTIPNAQVVGEQVANSNAGQLNCQVLTDLYLPGRVDERQAKEIAFEAAVTSQYVFLGKPIVVLVQDDFRTTFVTRIRVRAYVLDPRFEFVFQSDVTERAREGFRAAGLMPEGDWFPFVVESGDAAAGGGAGAGAS